MQLVHPIVHLLDLATSLRSIGEEAVMVWRSMLSTMSPIWRTSRAAEVSASGRPCPARSDRDKAGSLVGGFLRWVDKLHEAVKRYVTAITRRAWTSRARAAPWRSSPSPSISSISATSSTRPDGAGEQEDQAPLKFSPRVLRSCILPSRRDGQSEAGAGVFMSGDSTIARQLLKEKVQIREAERSASESHLARLREGGPRAWRRARCIWMCCAT